MKMYISKHRPEAGVVIRIALVVTAIFFLSLASVVDASDGRQAIIGSKIDNNSCQNAKEITSLVALGNVYLGEVHGTNEAPKLVGCLVDATLAKGISPLVVSLELPKLAKDTKSPIWSGIDGRTSKAMKKLVEHLEYLESSHRIVLDFQLTGSEASDEIVNRDVGVHLRDLASRFHVIALGGNFHSQRKNVFLPSLGYKPAGFFVGTSIKTVFVDSTGKGRAWFCSKICGENVASNMTDGGYVGQLSDGAVVGHDYIYKVGPFTSSSPAVEHSVSSKN